MSQKLSEKIASYLDGHPTYHQMEELVQMAKELEEENHRLAVKLTKYRATEELYVEEYSTEQTSIFDLE